MTCVLYRAVTVAEYKDIQTINGFRAYRGSLEDKQFAKSLECGHYYGREIVERIDRESYILLAVNLNSDKFCNQAIQRLDDCNAVSIDRDDILLFNQSIQKIQKIN